MLRRLTPTAAAAAPWRRRLGRTTPLQVQANPLRGLRVVAAVNATTHTETAVDDCLERVLGPDATPNASTFAVVFFEGHDHAGVQGALNSFAERRPQAPPVIGCGLGESAYEQQKRRLKQQQSARRVALASSSPSGKPGHKLTPWSSAAPSATALSSSDEPSQESSESFRSPKIVTVLGLGFQGEELAGGEGGGRGRVEALPVYAEGGCFPNILGKDSVVRIFELPKDKQPLFFMLSKDDQSVPASDLQDTNQRLGNLLPNSTRLCALSSGNPSSVVSSFPAGDAPLVGVCLTGDIPLQEQAGLARKTLGAFGFNAISTSGAVCDELFVPSQPRRAGWLLDPRSSSIKMDTLERVQEQVWALEEQSRQERRWRQQQQQQQQELGVFKVDEVVFPGMTKRFRIFEPRYRALVKQCLAEDVPLAILPLSRGGNTVATTARVSGLHNVEADGRCEVEITGIARCSVKTMWMKGESFGLFEAVVELFGDDQAKAEEEAGVNAGTASKQPRDTTADAAGETSGRKEVTGSDQGDRKGEESAGGDGGDGEGLVAELPELERLRIEVSAIMQKELYRTRTRGRSPLWPGWDGSVSHADAQAALTVASSPPLPTPLTIKTADDSAEAAASSGSGGDCSNNAGGDDGENDAVDGTSGGGIGVSDKSSIGGLDPCDLDAEALSYWAAHNVEAGALMKHEWLSSTSTAARLRGVRDLCRFALARHRDRSAVDGGVLSRPLSALRDLTSR